MTPPTSAVAESLADPASLPPHRDWGRGRAPSARRGPSPVAELRPFRPTDLVLFVWPRRSAADGDVLERADSSAWAMLEAKADRVRILVSVVDDTIVHVWGVSGATNEMRSADEKSRRVNWATFTTHDDTRLHYLVGQRSQIASRRNPQTTIELRDLLGSDVLVADVHDEPRHGVVRIGDFTLTVREDGTADLVYPGTASVLLRPEA